MYSFGLTKKYFLETTHEILIKVCGKSRSSMIRTEENISKMIGEALRNKKHKDDLIM